MKRAILLLILAFAQRAEAQTYWRYSGGVAGVVVGGAVGLVIEEVRQMPCFLDFDNSNRCVPHPEIPIVTAAMLAFAGFHSGLDADRVLGRGDSLSTWQDFHLRTQLIIAPMILAPIAVARWTPGEDSPALVVASIAAGALGGYLLQRGLSPALEPRPRVGIAPTRDGVSFSVTLVR
jgi:hypothetical protein